MRLKLLPLPFRWAWDREGMNESTAVAGTNPAIAVFIGLRA
jgi:hypothetical protein